MSRERGSDRMHEAPTHPGHGAMRGAAAVLALFALVVGAGCGRKRGSVPADFSPNGQSGEENFLTVEMIKIPVDTVNTVPAVRLRIYDRTRADGYRIYRRVGSQGFDLLSGAPVRFDGSFDNGYETYEAIDRDWQPGRAAEYLARGEVGGIESPAAPLTNLATLPAGASADDLVPGNLTILCPTGFGNTPTPTDSTPVVVWQPVPGATRYLLRVKRLDNRLFFYGFTPNDGSSFYQLGSGLGTIFLEKLLTLTSLFDWTVEAFDNQSRVVGRSSTYRLQARTITVHPESLTYCAP